jgi:hypothetical protein
MHTSEKGKHGSTSTKPVDDILLNPNITPTYTILLKKKTLHVIIHKNLENVPKGSV